MRHNRAVTNADRTPAQVGPQRRARRRGTLTDMLRSLSLVAIMLLGVLGYARLGTPAHPAPSTDAAAVVEAARTVAPFPILAASVLPKGWYPNAASFDPMPGAAGRWRFHVGYTDGSQQYAGITASNAADAAQLLPGAADVAVNRQVPLAGLTFAEYRISGGTPVEAWVARGTGHDGAAYVIRIERAGAKGATTAHAFLASLKSTGAPAVG